LENLMLLSTDRLLHFLVERDSQLQKLREGVEDVRVIVQNNIEKTVEREEKLADLDERADALLRKNKIRALISKDLQREREELTGNNATEKPGADLPKMEKKSRLQQCHGDVEEVQVIIQETMNKVQEREYSLEELDERGEALRKT
ncbi:synaptobrevin 2-like, partial [Clarias magur]